MFFLRCNEIRILRIVYVSVTIPKYSCKCLQTAYCLNILSTTFCVCLFFHVFTFYFLSPKQIFLLFKYMFLFYFKFAYIVLVLDAVFTIFFSGSFFLIFSFAIVLRTKCNKSFHVKISTFHNQSKTQIKHK